MKKFGYWASRIMMGVQAVFWVMAVGLVGKSDYETEIGVYTLDSWYVRQTLIIMAGLLISYALIKLFRWVESVDWFKVGIDVCEVIVDIALDKLKRGISSEEQFREIEDVFDRVIRRIKSLHRYLERRWEYEQKEDVRRGNRAGASGRAGQKKRRTTV